METYSGKRRSISRFSGAWRKRVRSKPACSTALVRMALRSSHVSCQCRYSLILRVIHGSLPSLPGCEAW